MVYMRVHHYTHNPPSGVHMIPHMDMCGIYGVPGGLALMGYTYIWDGPPRSDSGDHISCLHRSWDQYEGHLQRITFLHCLCTTYGHVWRYVVRVYMPYVHYRGVVLHTLISWYVRWCVLSHSLCNTLMLWHVRWCVCTRWRTYDIRHGGVYHYHICVYDMYTLSYLSWLRTCEVYVSVLSLLRGEVCTWGWCVPSYSL